MYACSDSAMPYVKCNNSIRCSGVARSLVLAGHLLYTSHSLALCTRLGDMSGTNIHGALARPGHCYVLKWCLPSIASRSPCTVWLLQCYLLNIIACTAHKLVVREKQPATFVTTKGVGLFSRVGLFSGVMVYLQFSNDTLYLGNAN